MDQDDRLKTEIHQDLLTIWDENGHGADVRFNLDTGTIEEILGWDDGNGLLENGAEMTEVIECAKRAIAKVVRRPLPSC